MQPRARRWTVLLGALGASALAGLALAARFEAGHEREARSLQEIAADGSLALEGIPRPPKAGAGEHAEEAPHGDELARTGLRVDGLVVDEAGKPVPETRVMFVPAHAEVRTPDFHSERVEATEGHFRLDIDPIRRGWVVAFAPAHLPTYVEVAPPGRRERLRIVIEEAPPLRVVLFGPDGSRLPGATVWARPAPNRLATAPSGPGAPTIELEHAEADEQGEALLRIEDRGAIELTAHSLSETWRSGLESRPFLLERAVGTVELRLESRSRIVITAADAATGNQIMENLRVRVELPPAERLASPAKVIRGASGRALVKGLLHGQVRLEVAADGYLPITRTVTMDGTGTRHVLNVQLERDPAQGSVVLVLEGKPAQHVEVLGRRRQDAPAAWRELRVTPIDRVPSEEDANVPALRSWRSQALALGTYDLLVVRWELMRPRPAPPADTRTACAWLPGVPIEARTITSRTVTPEPGLFVSVPRLGAAPHTLRSLRVLGPDATPLPLFVYDPRWIPPGPSGLDERWEGIKLVSADHTPGADTLLGPYPFPSVTLELEPKDRARETRVYDGR